MSRFVDGLTLRIVYAWARDHGPGSRSSSEYGWETTGRGGKSARSNRTLASRQPLALQDSGGARGRPSASRSVRSAGGDEILRHALTIAHT